MYLYGSYLKIDHSGLFLFIHLCISLFSSHISRYGDDLAMIRSVFPRFRLFLLAALCLGKASAGAQNPQEYWRTLTAALGLFPFNFSLSVTDETGLLYLYEKNVDYYKDVFVFRRSVCLCGKSGSL